MARGSCHREGLCSPAPFHGGVRQAATQESVGEGCSHWISYYGEAGGKIKKEGTRAVCRAATTTPGIAVAALKQLCWCVVALGKEFIPSKLAYPAFAQEFTFCPNIDTRHAGPIV